MLIKKNENTVNLLMSALVAAKKAGDAILGVYKKDFLIEYKDDESPLTLADKRSHEIILNQLSISPDNLLPVLSEEGEDIPYKKRRGWEYFWLVDPLDGTNEFISRNGEFTVNIALINKDRPVLGTIYVPVKDVIYFGAEGMGAYKLLMSDIAAGKKIDEIDGLSFLDDLIKASQKLQLYEEVIPVRDFVSRIKVIGSRSHMSEQTENFIRELEEKYGEIEFIPAGSSLKFCVVAEGKADVYPRFGPTMEWDTAAGQVIVEQAGGKVLEVETNRPLRYNKENLLNPYFVVGKTVRYFLSSGK